MNSNTETMKVTRAIYICKSCAGAYADEPVSQCDCMPDKRGFIKSSFTYEIPKSERIKHEHDNE